MANAERPSTSAHLHSAAPMPRTTTPWRGAQRTAFAVLLAFSLATVLLFIVSEWFVPHSDSKNAQAAPPKDPGEVAQHDNFASWTTPDVALVLTGEMHGYLQPCGCSEPQFGGLSRRYNFIQSLKGKGWPVVALDLGDISQTTGAVADQRQLKYSVAMKALDLMGYTAVGIGANEFVPQLFETLSNYSLNNPTPTVLAANLLKRNPGELFYNLNVKSAALSQSDRGSKVGVVGMIGPSVVAKIRDLDAKFADNNAAALEQALMELKAQKAEVYALLYQGSVWEAENAAKWFADRHARYPKAVPALDVVMCLSEASEPPSLPRKVGNTLIVEIGHKGRYVGVVGVYGTAPQRRMRYHLASIGPEYKGELNEVNRLMETYAADVKRNGYIHQYPRAKHPIHVNFPQAKYVGSAICGGCHDHAYKVWSDSRHSQAFSKLVNATDPGFRNHDGECVKCHVVGFGYHTGYLDKNNTARINAKLENVGCEVCHGPGSIHANNPNDKQIQSLMNPYKTNTPGLGEHVVKHRLNLIDMSCQRCHDTDNDNHWSFDKWTKGHIIHTTPPLGAQAPAAGIVTPVIENSKEQ